MSSKRRGFCFVSFFKDLERLFKKAALPFAAAPLNKHGESF
jgi:hypothetical protein